MSHLPDTSSEVTLDSIYKDILHWRANKSDYPDRGIPDSTWKKIFQLEAEGYPKKDLLKILSLNSRQYDMKRAQIHPSKHIQSPHQTTGDTKEPVIQNTQEKEDQVVSFHEVFDSPSLHYQSPSLTKDRAEKTRAQISQLRSTNNSVDSFLDRTTIIVECIHPNGHRLKIHTTSQSLDIVMKTFYMQGGIA